MLFFFANVNYAAVEETWSSVSGDAGEGTLGVVLADTSPCHSPFEVRAVFSKLFGCLRAVRGIPLHGK